MPQWRQLGGKVLDRLPFVVRDPIQNVTQRSSRPRRLSYDEVWSAIIGRSPDRHLPVYPGAYVDWDNTARYRRRATIFEGASPARFEHFLTQLVQKVGAAPPAERMIFINAWNEWAESAYLEPDERHGMGYLEAVQRALRAGARA